MQELTAMHIEAGPSIGLLDPAALQGVEEHRGHHRARLGCMLVDGAVGPFSRSHDRSIDEDGSARP